MKCTNCGSDLEATNTDLPFKVAESSTVIIKEVPVLQCLRCPQYLIANEALARVDEILERLVGGTELEVVRYVA